MKSQINTRTISLIYGKPLEFPNVVQIILFLGVRHKSNASVVVKGLKSSRQKFAFTVAFLE